MKNKFSILLASTVLVSSLMSVSVFALGSGLKHEHKVEKSEFMLSEKAERFMKHKFKKMAKHLELTGEQRQQAKAIYQKAKESRLALKDSMKDFHQQSKSLMMADNLDEQAFLDLHRQYQDSFGQMALIKIKTKHSFVQILNDEQKQKMKSHQKSRKGRKASE